MKRRNGLRARRCALLFGLMLLLAACNAPPQNASPPPVSATDTAVIPEAGTPLAAYPAAEPSPTPAHAYPVETRPTAVATPLPAETPASGGDEQLFLPIVSEPEAPTAVPANTSIPPTPTPTPIPTADFAAARLELQSRGEELSYAKIGFHVGLGGSTAGLEEWMRRLDAAGVPFFLKSVDNAQPIFFAQELMRQSGVPHVLVYRKAAGGSYDWDVPNYDLPAQQAAEIHWQAHADAFPPELDRNMVWLETINEIDKNRAEWLGQFALATAALAQRDGYRWAAFGWSSGEPEPHQWETPSMLAFLRLAGANPDRLAIALHEYSYTLDNIADQYPYKVGRFQALFRIADKHGIPRPTVLITEWGWTYQQVPPPHVAMQDIAWAARLYARYPEIQGAAIWYLGGGWADISRQAQQLIYPVMVFSLQNYYGRPSQPAPINVEAFQP